MELATLGKRVRDDGIADTEQIVSAGKLLEIEVLDRLVIGKRKLEFRYLLKQVIRHIYESTADDIACFCI